MSMAGMALQAVGGAVDAYYIEKSGDEEKAYLNAQADLTTDLYAEEERRLRDKGRELIGEQQVYYSKSGVQISSGSPAKVISDTAADIELDALTLRYSGRLEADALRHQGSVAEVSADRAANVRLISAGQSVASAYGQYAGSRGSGQPKSLLGPTTSTTSGTEGFGGYQSNYNAGGYSASASGDSDWDSGW